MGGSQSKAETVFSRFPKETELLDSLKITPAVMERINAANGAPTQEKLAQQQQMILEQQQQLARQTHLQYEKELMEQREKYEENIKNLKNANQDKLLEIQLEQIDSTDSVKDEFVKLEATIREKYESEITETQIIASKELESKCAELQAKNEALEMTQLELESKNTTLEMTQQELETKNTALEMTVQELDQMAPKLESLADVENILKSAEEKAMIAQNSIRDATERLANERQEFLNRQQKEKDEILSKTRKFFSPNETKIICGDITDAVAKCYSENPKNTMICAEVVRNLQACVTPEKQNYLLKQNLRPNLA